jgi:hypothetical protein
MLQHSAGAGLTKAWVFPASFCNIYAVYPVGKSRKSEFLVTVAVAVMAR